MENFEVVELTSTEMKQIDGGSWKDHPHEVEIQAYSVGYQFGYYAMQCVQLWFGIKGAIG